MGEAPSTINSIAGCCWVFIPDNYRNPSDIQQWLDAPWAEIVRTPREDEEYYGNTLKMLAMIVLAGNCWTP